jgi:membrane-associated protease RseP (regulator of RpoE activity)
MPLLGGVKPENAVRLESGIRYMLPQDVRKGRFMYYYVEAQKGDEIEATVQLPEVGVQYADNGEVKRGGYTSVQGGIGLRTSENVEIEHGFAIGPGDTAKASFKPRAELARYHVVLGSATADMPKDSRFVVTVMGSGVIGLVLAEDAPIVKSVIAYSPAAQAGILVEDEILEIDRQTTKGMSASDLFVKIRGRPQTAVVLKIFRRYSNETKEFNVTRKER